MIIFASWEIAEPVLDIECSLRGGVMALVCIIPNSASGIDRPSRTTRFRIQPGEFDRVVAAEFTGL
jgi:hypothetical protein